MYLIMHMFSYRTYLKHGTVVAGQPFPLSTMAPPCLPCPRSGRRSQSETERARAAVTRWNHHHGHHGGRRNSNRQRVSLQAETQPAIIRTPLPKPGKKPGDRCLIAEMESPAGAQGVTLCYRQHLYVFSTLSTFLLLEESGKCFVFLCV